MNRPKHRFLGPEGKRNRANADLFRAMLCVVWGDNCDIITGHHINFQFDGDLSTEDEIPSADCLLFDHDIMCAVFGEKAYEIMRNIAILRPWARENYVRSLFVMLHPEHEVGRDPKFPEELPRAA